MANLKRNIRNVNPLAYVGPDRVQYIVENRRPTINDYNNFELGAIWLNRNVTPVDQREIWTLVGKDDLIATWVLLDTGGTVLPDIETLTGDVGTNPVGPDANHNVDVFGDRGVNESIFDLNFRNIRTRGDAAANTLEVHLNNSINLPNTNTTGTEGVIGLESVRFMHNFGGNNDNTFLGTAAGNFTNTGTENVGIGINSLTTLTNGINNVAVGGESASSLTGGDDNISIGRDSLLSLTTGSRNIALGTDSLSAMTTANESIAIGFQALDSCTAGDNIAIGDQAGGAVTTGTRNVLIGNDSGDALTIGVDNVAIGNNALGAAITINQNTAIGSAALANYNAASATTAVGFNALTNCTTGTTNTAIGTQSMQSLTIGESNTCLGYLSGFAITTANNNTAIGDTALRMNVSSMDNTAVGWSALFNATGEENTALGSAAGLTLTTGSYNTILGYAAAGVTLTTGSSNIIIGHETVVAAASESNTTRIGRQGAGDGQQNRCFISGIRGITTGVADAINVLIDSAGQLGTVSSSIRFKENVRGMADESSAIYDLRPVTFNYKEDESKSKQYGLIAEEVEKYIPRLVVYDEDGKPMALNDRFLPFMLLNELQKLQDRVKELEKRLNF